MSKVIPLSNVFPFFNLLPRWRAFHRKYKLMPDGSFWPRTDKEVRELRRSLGVQGPRGAVLPFPSPEK